MSELKEKELYGQVKSEFEKLFNHKFGNCHLEITATGIFSEKLKSKVKQDIVFAFIKRMKGSESRSPDITGFVSSSFGFPTSSFSVADLTTIEAKNETISLGDVYQAKMYVELFDAKYGFLVSTDLIPTEIKKLHNVHSILNRFRYGAYLGLVELIPRAAVSLTKAGFLIHRSGMTRRRCPRRQKRSRIRSSEPSGLRVTLC